MARAIDADELEMFPYSEGAGTEEQISEWIEQTGLSEDDTASRARDLCWKVIDGFINVVKTQPTLTQPNEPERAGLYGKYTVYKNKDGSLVSDCFVLRPAKDPAAIIALRAYAAATDNAELSADIINWVKAEPNEPLTLEELQEMDKPTPVWWKRADCWCLCERGFIIVPNGNIYEFEETDVTFYRRPPEEMLKDGKE